jgi:hypothetical protein
MLAPHRHVVPRSWLATDKCPGPSHPGSLCTRSLTLRHSKVGEKGFGAQMLRALNVNMFHRLVLGETRHFSLIFNRRTRPGSQALPKT